MTVGNMLFPGLSVFQHGRGAKVGGLIPCLAPCLEDTGSSGIPELLKNTLSLLEEQMLYCTEGLKGCAVPVAYLVCCLA